MAERLPTGSAVEKRLLGDPGFAWDGLVGSSVPVVVEFRVDEFFGYFRARGVNWTVEISRDQNFDPGIPENRVFTIDALYGVWPEAGYMPLEIALEFVETAIAAFRAIKPSLPVPP